MSHREAYTRVYTTVIPTLGGIYPGIHHLPTHPGRHIPGYTPYLHPGRHIPGIYPYLHTLGGIYPGIYTCYTHPGRHIPGVIHPYTPWEAYTRVYTSRTPGGAERSPRPLEALGTLTFLTLLRFIPAVSPRFDRFVKNVRFRRPGVGASRRL